MTNRPEVHHLGHSIFLNVGDLNVEYIRIVQLNLHQQCRLLMGVPALDGKAYSIGP